MKSLIASAFFASFLLGACRDVEGPPRDSSAVAEAQAELTPDPAQAALWRQAAGTPAIEGLEEAIVDTNAVRRRRPVQIYEQQAETRPAPFSEEVEAAVAPLDVPELEEPFSGTATIRSMDGQILELDLGGGRVLSVQVKVPGAPLAFATGDAAQVYLRSGTPFERHDIIAIRSDDEVLVYALVGGGEAVRFTVPNFDLRVAQDGEVTRNTMAVRFGRGRRGTRTLAQGEQTAFDSAALTVKVLASLAIEGPSANAVAGRPYRVEVLAWRSRQ